MKTSKDMQAAMQEISADHIASPIDRGKALQAKVGKKGSKAKPTKAVSPPEPVLSPHDIIDASDPYTTYGIPRPDESSKPEPNLALAFAPEPKKSLRKSKKSLPASSATRDISTFILHIAVDKKKPYDKRGYLQASHNAPNVPNDPTERATTTMYRSETGEILLFNAKVAMEKVKEFIASMPTDKTEFTNKEIQLKFKVFGCASSDNIRNVCNKLAKQSLLTIRKDPPDASHYVYIYTPVKPATQ